MKWGNSFFSGTTEESECCAKECNVLKERCKSPTALLLVDCPEVVYEWRHTYQKRSYSARREFWSLPHANSETTAEKKTTTCRHKCLCLRHPYYIGVYNRPIKIREIPYGKRYKVNSKQYSVKKSWFFCCRCLFRTLPIGKIAGDIGLMIAV